MDLKIPRVPEELVLPVQALARAACLLQGALVQAVQGCPVKQILKEHDEYLTLACQVIDLWTAHLTVRKGTGFLNASEERDEESAGETLSKDMKRVEELIKEISAHTRDVSLRYEAGITLVRLGREQEGAHWLASVLLLDPNNQPARKALADCLEKLGDPQLAAYYRRVVENGK